MTEKEKRELIKKIEKTSGKIKKAPLNNDDNEFTALVVLMVKLFNKHKLEDELNISHPTFKMWSRGENLPCSAAMRYYILDRFAELLKK